MNLVIVIKVLIDHGLKARKEVNEGYEQLCCFVFFVNILYLDSTLLSQRATLCILYFVFVFSMTNRKILGQGKGLRGALLSQGGRAASRRRIRAGPAYYRPPTNALHCNAQHFITSTFPVTFLCLKSSSIHWCAVHSKMCTVHARRARWKGLWERLLWPCCMLFYFRFQSEVQYMYCTMCILEKLGYCTLLQCNIFQWRHYIHWCSARWKGLWERLLWPWDRAATVCLSPITNAIIIILILIVTNVITINLNTPIVRYFHPWFRNFEISRSWPGYLKRGNGQMPDLSTFGRQIPPDIPFFV